MRTLNSSSEGQILDRRRPIIATAADVAGAHVIPAHHHPRGQLLYAVSGVMRVSVGKDTWSVTSCAGVWVPPGAYHQVEAPGALSYRSLFVNPSAAGTLPAQGTPFEISALTRELIVEAAGFGASYRAGSAEARLIGVLHDRLGGMPKAKLAVSLGRDARVRRVCKALLDNPADDRDLEAWGRLVGASARTLARRFQSETGMTFGAWQQHLRLSIACERLANGESVTRIALDLGYASPSAFSAMFRRVLGTSPSSYLS